jgi:serine/threonine protein kinase
MISGGPRPGHATVIRKLGAGELLDGRFEVIEPVAGGGSSSVYRGTDRKTGEVVAIKVLSDARVDFLQRFEREVGILANLSHPVIVRYVAHGELASGSSWAPYLVTEWIAGETLSERLRATGLTLRESVALTRQLAGALAMVHDHDLVHRDVKPANIVFRERGGAIPKLIDFGIARSTLAPRTITGTGIMVGTPGFVSPEQARGSVSVGPPSDVFSLGCVLYACATGQAPFGSASTPLTFMKIMTESPPALRSIVPEAPRELEALLGDMLAKDARRRPANGAELLARLEALDEVPDGEARIAEDAGPKRRRPLSGDPTDPGSSLGSGTLATQRVAILVLGGGIEPLAERDLERLGELARSFNVTDVIALPEEVIIIRASHAQLSPLVKLLLDLAMICARELGDRVLSIAEDEEAEWAVDTVQQESLARLFVQGGTSGPLVLVHERLRSLVGDPYVAEARGGNLVVNLA